MSVCTCYLLRKLCAWARWASSVYILWLSLWVVFQVCCGWMTKVTPLPFSYVNFSWKPLYLIGSLQPLAWNRNAFVRFVIGAWKKRKLIRINCARMELGLVSPNKRPATPSNSIRKLTDLTENELSVPHTSRSCLKWTVFHAKISCSCKPQSFLSTATLAIKIVT